MRRGSSAPTGPWSGREMCAPATGEGRGGGGRGEREGSGGSHEGMLFRV